MSYYNKQRKDGLTEVVIGSLNMWEQLVDENGNPRPDVVLRPGRRRSVKTIAEIKDEMAACDKWIERFKEHRSKVRSGADTLFYDKNIAMYAHRKVALMWVINQA